MKWLKILIRVKQGKLLFYAKSGYEHINGFTYRYASFSQQAEIISALYCNILATKRENR